MDPKVTHFNHNRAESGLSWCNARDLGGVDGFNGHVQGGDSTLPLGASFPWSKLGVALRGLCGTQTRYEVPEPNQGYATMSLSQRSSGARC